MGASVRASSPDVGEPQEVAGKYRLFARLGQGGMADVFLANAHGPMGFNKLVVVKRLRAGLVDQPDVVTMFLDEAKLAARLTHANIVHTYEVGEQDGDYFIAMEYLEGQPLHRIIARAKETHTSVPEPVWLKITCDALVGLHHAHEARDYDGTPLSVVHRDISPHNIFVTYDGEVKIVDFGIAKAALSSVTTEDGVLKGKVHYMSPEQAQGRTTDRRADVYAAGGVLWELLAGERVQPGNATTALASLSDGQVRGLREVAPHVSLELEAVVKHAMALNVEQRAATAEELRTELAAYAKKGPGLASNQEVAALVGKLFEEDRRDIQRRIRDHLSTSAAVSPSSTRLLELPPVSGSALLRKTPEASSAPVGATEAAAELTHAGPKWSGRAVLFGALSAAGIGAAIFIVVRPGAQAPPESAPVLTSAANSASAPTAATEGPAKSDEKIEVRVRVAPANATLSVDGAPVGRTPYRVTVLKDSALHEIRAVAPGFLPHVTAAPFDRNLDLEIALERATEPGPSGRPATTPPVARPRASASTALPLAPDAPSPIKLRTER
jgi:serine/threonine-protein kinase